MRVRKAEIVSKSHLTVSGFFENADEHTLTLKNKRNTRFTSLSLRGVGIDGNRTKFLFENNENKKQHSMKALIKSFHLNGHPLEIHSQTWKLECYHISI